MNGTLDINTPRGRIAAEDQIKAARIVFPEGSESRFIHTATDDAAVVDGVIESKGHIVGIAEIKSRDATYEQFVNEWNSEWLLTYRKLADIACVSQLLRLPAYGFLYCVFSSVVLVVRLTNEHGAFVCRYRVEKTRTQATCNGGEAERANAFISLIGAKIYR